ncbi:protein ACCELERATED CELL DEATH 6-like [Prosopis cineraria]|uniref:protein ACCELERATED CELL DEATH 6-like n=1 Tax=Prosopis cineraria TaxID=364024 RepID=UPI00240F8FA9|nr:protein ACCELERATED CELL DEATH 6-like [Prosopis cineraria]
MTKLDARWRPICYERVDKLMVRRWSGSADNRFLFASQNDDVMIYELYKAVRDENQDVFNFVGVLDEVCGQQQIDLSIIVDQVTPAGDSLLHVAAEFGRKEIGELIACFFPKLLCDISSSSLFPLQGKYKRRHSTSCAARTKNNEVMKIILLTFENIDTSHLITSENKFGNTPLHEAVLSKNLEGVNILLNAHDDTALAIYWNNPYPNKSPIYLAVLTDDVEILRRLLQIPFPSNLSISKCRGNSPLHAAILERKPHVLQEILNVREELMYLRDENEETPLHCAARVGYLEGVSILLNKSTLTAFQKNSEGNLPVHLACEGGHVQVVKKLLEEKFPWHDVRLWLNNNGQNMLHIAAMNGEKNVVKHLLRNPKIIHGEIMNERDVNGDTPLHLASRNLCLWTLLLLSQDKKIDVNLVNNKDFTARDIVRVQCKIPMRRQESLKFHLFAVLVLIVTDSVKSANIQILGARHVASINTEWNVKEAANALILVAILIVTVTFAAGFSVPGGIHGADDKIPKERGTAVFGSQTLFDIFMTFNTIAMYSSTLGSIILLWVQLGDRRFAEGVYRFAKIFVYVALLTMPVAFLAAICLTIRNNILLTCILSVIGFIFIFFIYFARILGRFSLGICLPFVRQAGALFIRIILVLFYGKNDILIGEEGGIINQNYGDEKGNQVDPLDKEVHQSNEAYDVHLVNRFCAFRSYHYSGP